MSHPFSEQFGPLIGKRVRITTNIVAPKDDRSEIPGDPTITLAGTLTSIGSDGTLHYTDPRPNQVPASWVARVEELR